MAEAIESFIKSVLCCDCYGIYPRGYKSSAYGGCETAEGHFQQRARKKAKVVLNPKQRKTYKIRRFVRFEYLVERTLESDSQTAFGKGRSAVAAVHYVLRCLTNWRRKEGCESPVYWTSPFQ